MKAFSVCLLLAGLSQAVQLYFNPEPYLPTKLSPGQANAALARHLGLESFERIGNDEELYSALAQQEPFVGRGHENALLLSLSEDDAADIIPPSLSPSLSFQQPLRIYSSLIPTYLERARHAYSHVYAQFSKPVGTPRILDIFSVPSPATEAFLSEMTALVEFLEDESTTDKFAALELRGLSAIAVQYGRASEQYRIASETIRGVLQSTLARPDIKLALMTAPRAAFERATSKRQDVLQQPPQSPLPQPTPAPMPAEPISGGVCYTTADVCANATDSCSGHGECAQASKAGRTCFVCACSATINEKGQTENWAGAACERKDVSGPFVLLTGTVVALILLIGGSIALLSGIGEQDLPSTLTGGVVPTTKRD
ncbi:hypothetical protein CERSUDRAFT_87059 [Gelatoporia subvermispora B]|uniref:Vacuolar sorting protein Vps3844 C-terminal domain-containing protein n=1 Tax=Ceriporiopsis subvermispora (strain B) TaxID=914234 RepID=M2R465_CERS8|nr:hypothetical protein CERSUDRAFT_87059 [Gelatoporia subvermispora B]